MKPSETRLKTLAALEDAARPLESSPDEYDGWLRAVGEVAHRFLATLPDRPGLLEGDRPHWLRGPLLETPRAFPDVLADAERALLQCGINSASGKFLGYVPGGGVPLAAIGDFLAALTNRYAGVYEPAPGAVEIENVVVRWLRELVGFPESAWGTLQSGGTLATLTAVIAARQTRNWEQWSRSPVYLTAESHYCIVKALQLAGLEAVPVRTVAVDSEYRMQFSHLSSLVAEDRKAGLEPWMLFATAGTVNTGAIDPLDALADLARREGLWFHVDGAYGGMFVATSRASRSLKAMALADSLVLDPHKGLFMPYGIGAVLVRDPARLKRGFSYQADYLADALNDAERSPADYSPELTRHFRALRLWICLQVHGFAPFRAALEEKLLLAELAQERLRELPGVEVGPEPQLSAVLFRLEAGDDATREWLDRVWARRRVYFNTTRLDGKLYLRFCILCFRTHLDEVELALREVVETLPDSRKHS